MPTGVIAQGLQGLGQGLQDVGIEQMKASILKDRDDNLARLMAERDQKQGDIRLSNDKSLAQYQNDLKTAPAREVGAAIDKARQPVNETWASEEGDYKATRTPTRTEALQAGIERAIQLGDFETAKNLREMAQPKLTKIGENESVINDRGDMVFRNTAGTERRRDEAVFNHQLDIDKLGTEYGLKRQLETFKKTHGETSTTALMRNVEYLVSSGVASNPTEAFNRLRTVPEKAEGDAIMGVLGTLMRDPRYRGRDGAARATSDATAIVKDIRGVGAGSASRGSSSSLFGSPDDVKRAYRSGQIDRRSALRELGNFGFGPD